MGKKGKRDLNLYDPATGKTHSLNSLIYKLGIMAVAKKYDVSESTVLKWKRGIHRPAKRTITQSIKGLF